MSSSILSVIIGGTSIPNMLGFQTYSVDVQLVAVVVAVATGLVIALLRSQTARKVLDWTCNVSTHAYVYRFLLHVTFE